MANRMIEVPVGATKIAAWAAASGGRAALGAGEDLLHKVQPNYQSRDEIRIQAILKKFEGRFGIFRNVLDMDTESPGKDDDLEERAYMAADTMIDQGIVQPHGIVGVRPTLPQETLWDPEMVERTQRATELLKLAFEEDHNVMAVPDSFPIVPSKYRGSRIGSAATWRAFAPELNTLAHQAHLLSDTGDQEVSMATITGSGYERTMFGNRDLQIIGSPIGHDLLALQTVGERSQDNVIAWLGRTAEAA